MKHALAFAIFLTGAPAWAAGQGPSFSVAQAIGRCRRSQCPLGLFRRPSLATNTTHRPLRLNELGFADVVSRLFLPNDLAQALSNLIIISAAAQHGFDVVLVDAEQAGADFAIGR